MSILRTAAHRRGKIALRILLVTCVMIAVVIGTLFVSARKTNTRRAQNVLTHTLARSDFIHNVVEQGEVESSNSLDIRCEVKARNGNGTTILDVVDEGTRVEPGDVLVRLDATSFDQELVQQQILCNVSESALIQAKNDLDTAEIALKEYEEGTFRQEEQQFQTEIFIAEENLRRAREYVNYSERLAARGYVTSQQLVGDRFAVEKAATELATAKTKLRVLQEYTRAKMVKTLDSAIKSAEARWKSERSSYDLEQSKLEEIKDQIEKCVIKAPQAGQVVYANATDRRGNNEFIVQPGAIVRERQTIIRLPDPGRMQVVSKINEGNVTLVKVDMPVTIKLDAFGDMEVRGEVTRVNEYPEPTSWFSSQAKEYATYVKVLDPPENIRPGLTADVSIHVRKLKNALQIPLTAILERGKQLFCAVKSGKTWETRQITLLGSNDKTAAVEAGVTEGEVVALTPRLIIDQLDLPEVEFEGPKGAREEEGGDDGDGDGGGDGDDGGGGRGGPDATRTASGGAPGPPGGGPSAGGGFDPSAVVGMMLTRMDTNQDGKLSEDEIPASQKERLSTADTNGDTFLDKGELIQALAKMGEDQGGGGGPPGDAAP